MVEFLKTIKFIKDILLETIVVKSVDFDAVIGLLCNNFCSFKQQKQRTSKFTYFLC